MKTGSRFDRERECDVSDFNALLRMLRESALPMESIEEDAVIDRIMTADLIWGYDPQQDAMPLFYGKELLADIAKGREAEFGYLALLCFRIDLHSDEPQLLCRTVQSLRGSCCYESSRGKE